MPAHAAHGGSDLPERAAPGASNLRPEVHLAARRLARACAHHVLELLSPTRCAACERPGRLICDACLDAMVRIDPRESCRYCGAPAGRLVCTECDMEPGAHDRCLAATVFEVAPARIVRAYKDGGERRLAREIASVLARAAIDAERCAPDRYGGLLTSTDAIVFVPVTAQAYRRRGFDHMEAIVRELAEMVGLPVHDALVKHGAADQRVFTREERWAAGRGAYEVVEPVGDMRLLLIDDVITTGSTLNAAASALVDAGAEHVDALAFARVWA